MMHDNTATPAVGCPLDRDVIRARPTGYLAVCNAINCPWTGLFPDQRPERAIEALETHVARACRQQVRGHAGQVTAQLTRLVDDRTFRSVTASTWTQYADLHGGGDPTASFAFDCGALSDPALDQPRTPHDATALDETIHRGDRIRVGYPHQDDGVVVDVTRTRTGGLPTWSVVYVPPDAPANADGSYRRSSYRWLNNVVPRDEGFVLTYEDCYYPVIGQADAQADLERWGISTD